MSEGKSTFKDKLQLFTMAWGVLGILWLCFSNVNGALGSVVTDSKLESHNINEKAHPFIHQNVKECEAKVELLSKHIEQSHDVEVALGARLTRILAADQETNRNFKSAAATYYEQEYRSLIRKGFSVEEAMLEALRQPFYTRPR